MSWYRSAHHSKFTTKFIRYEAKRYHTQDRAGEGQTGDDSAVLVTRQLSRAIYTRQACVQSGLKTCECGSHC